jgi:hypothetical protein
MPANGMTKVLLRQSYMEFVKQLGLVNITKRVTGTLEAPKLELSAFPYM